MKKLTLLPVLVILFMSCTKSDQPQPVVDQARKNAFRLEGLTNAPAPVTGYTLYTIPQGGHYCDKSTIKSVSTQEMKFNAIFDASAIYTSVTPINQYDVNKLWGFSEGLSNQYNSCRIGWSWNDGAIGGVNQIGTTALRLSAYAYVQGVRNIKEIAVVPLNTPIWCSIKPSGASYICTVSYTVSGVTNKFSATVPRGTTATTASGYQQFPYFGGNETAPHPVYIFIQSL